MFWDMVPSLDILFSSNHNIHKSSYCHCFRASDPLIDNIYECCDLTKKVYLTFICCNMERATPVPIQRFFDASMIYKVFHDTNVSFGRSIMNWSSIKVILAIFVSGGIPNQCHNRLLYQKWKNKVYKTFLTLQ